MPVRVLIADDQALVRGGLRMIIEADPQFHVVAEAGNGREAVDLARAEQPDLVLMDIRMPVLDGLEAAAHLMAARQPPRIVMLTTFDADELVYRALKLGASGFLLKDTPPQELLTALRTAVRGDAIVSPGLTQRLIDAYLERPVSRSDPRLHDLTDREREVLALIAQGLNNEEIGRELHMSPATAKTHVGRILSKLEVRDRVQAVVFAFETGIVRPGSGEYKASG